ncbi:hypothetical protein [Rhodospirillum sp. A1_3_36]|uniref:hypothetical protein n=1 Tax=Rhodospirillum sp. A1_3_36 TaxID=3391666 RepID=UPI0039A63C02
MFPLFILGLLLLVGLILLAKWFVNTEPRHVLRSLYWVAGLSIVGSGLFLVLTGRLGWAAATLAAALPWGLRLLRILGGIGLLKGAFGGGSRGGAGSSGRDRISEVMSVYLRMKLDHNTGGMTGEVVAGPLAGRSLASLDEEELKGLIQLVSADPDSQALLESWLDRERPGWRASDAESGESVGPGARGQGGDGPMTRAEALLILGLEEPVDAEVIAATYRRLMRQAHPDHGGSAWLAAKINQARDVLLNR